MEQMSEKDIKELISIEFSELLYAKYSPLGATSAILNDYDNSFEHNTKEYYTYIKSLFLINCTSDNLEWYKKNDPEFLVRRVILELKETIQFEPAGEEMLDFTHLVENYLFNKIDGINRKNNSKSTIELIESYKYRYKINQLELEHQALKTQQERERERKRIKELIYL
ncbi:hypothetical protein [Priestia megaterium]